MDSNSLRGSTGIWVLCLRATLRAVSPLKGTMPVLNPVNFPHASLTGGFQDLVAMCEDRSRFQPEVTLTAFSCWSRSPVFCAAVLFSCQFHDEQVFVFFLFLLQGILEREIRGLGPSSEENPTQWIYGNACSAVIV